MISLVLVDHTLGVSLYLLCVFLKRVLILVLVDHALGECTVNTALMMTSLNPCFSGPCSRRRKATNNVASNNGLNPCFSGPCSRSPWKYDNWRSAWSVLILVLVDHALGDIEFTDKNILAIKVLILVLVDHALGELSISLSYACSFVLILVLVDHALGVALKK